MAHDLLVRHPVLVGRGHKAGAHTVRRDRLPNRAGDARQRRTLFQDLPEASGSSRPLCTVPQRSTFRKIGPDASAACWSHKLSAAMGHVPWWRPRAIPISVPAPSLSVLDRTISRRIPSSVQVTCSTSSATSSARRNAPAKQTRNSAWSRMPAKSVPQVASSRLISEVVRAAERRGGSPWVREYHAASLVWPDGACPAAAWRSGGPGRWQRPGVAGWTTRSHARRRPNRRQRPLA
jgi:hypothetical protein